MATTKQRLIEAALDTLRHEGFAGTSARAIARRGDFNQALIFYHFGTLNGLLLAALDHASETQLERYRSALAEASSLEDSVRIATELYREDLRSGHVTTVSEMIAGSLSSRELAPEVVKRMEPWIDLTEQTLRDILERLNLAEMIPPREAAFVIVAMSLGVNLLHVVDPDAERAEAVFDLAGRLAKVVVPMLGSR